MAKKTVPMSPWEKLPGHNWKTTQKSRQDADADVIEEVYIERWIYLAALAAVAVFALGWWWQAPVDGWSRAVVLSATVVVTAYIVVMRVATMVFWVVSRFIPNV